MNKEFDKWNIKKKEAHTQESITKFQHRHILFMKVGTNVGYEQDGKGEDFLRPVLVYKKFNNRVFLGIPLTSKPKYDKFHFEFEYKKGKNSYAILSQIRLFDIKRAKYYDGKISLNFFEKLQKKLLDLIVTPLQEEGECTKAICKNTIPQKEQTVKMQKDSKIFVAGSTGLVGSAIVRKLIEKGYRNIIGTYHKRVPTIRQPLPTYIQLDLLDSIAVQRFFEQHKPDFVFLAAAKVGGIIANNTYRADFIYENLQIQNNVIHQSYLSGVKKLMFLGSTCIYPKNAPQPMKEEYLLTSELEYTNEPYAIAKIAGIKMCESYNLQYGTNFISVMPTNLYGENDNFDLEKSHVLPALIRKIYLGKLLESVKWEVLSAKKRERNWELILKDLSKNPLKCVKCYELSAKIIDENSSKEDILKALEYHGIKLNTSHLTPNTSKPKVLIEIWGSGNPKREFLYSDDMADACIFLMERIDFKDILNTTHLTPNTNEYFDEIRNTHLNIGTGKDISIKELAYLIKDIVGFKGEFYFNTSKPDGTMRKVTDVSKLHSLGWKYKVELEEGIKRIYKWYIS